MPASAKHVGSGTPEPKATAAGVNVAPVPLPYLNDRSEIGVPAVQADKPLLFKSNTCSPGPMMSYAGLSLAGYASATNVPPCEEMIAHISSLGLFEPGTNPTVDWAVRVLYPPEFFWLTNVSLPAAESTS